MKQTKTAVVLLCMSVFSLTEAHQKSLSADAKACRAQTAAFRANVGLNGRKMLYESDTVGEQTLSLTNAQERIMLFREFVKEFYVPSRLQNHVQPPRQEVFRLLTGRDS